MTVHIKDEDYYGDSQQDLQEFLLKYSTANGYPTHHYADAICKCGTKLFKLFSDDVEGVAIRECIKCGEAHPIGDSANYLEEAEVVQNICLCGKEVFEITVGVSLYENSEDVHWLYLGARCPECKLIGNYGDWKNEYPNYKEFLEKI